MIEREEIQDIAIILALNHTEIEEIIIQSDVDNRLNSFRKLDTIPSYVKQDNDFNLLLSDDTPISKNIHFEGDYNIQDQIAFYTSSESFK